MQPNVVTGNRTPQLGQYQSRTNYGYGVATNAYRPNLRNVPSANNATMGINFTNYSGGPSTSSLYSNVPTSCNISNTIQILQPAPTSCPITFRKLPFYELKEELLKPAVLSPNHHLSLPPNIKTNASQEFQVGFVMTCAMASHLSLNRDAPRSDFPVQAQLRFTSFDTASPLSTQEYDDFLPLGLFIRLNGRQCATLPPSAPSSRQNQETRRLPRPINVSHLMKLSPMNANILTVNWIAEAGKQFAVTLNIVEKLSSAHLLDNLKAKPKISVDVTKLTIRQQYRPIDEDTGSTDAMMDDEDIATTIVRVSLLCPLAKFRMQYPAKGKDCTHLQCFDGSAYIILNEKRPMWNCPVCNKPLQYDDLSLDEYFMNVLQHEDLSGDCQEVQLLVDGSWKCYFEDSSSENKDSDSNKGNTAASSPEVGESKNSPENGARGRVTSTSESVTKATASNNDVVNLLSDDEDEGNEATNGVQDTAGPTSEGNTLDEEMPISHSEAVNGATSGEEPIANNQSNGMVVDDDKGARMLPTVPDTSTTRTNAAPIHRAGTVISLDSPSPPTSQASPTQPSLADLNI